MYEPEVNDSTDFESLKQYYDNELQKIANSLLIGETDSLECRVWTEFPPRPYDGIVAWLDNSIVGVAVSGLHIYENGSWHSVATISLDGAWEDSLTVITAGGLRGVNSDYDLQDYNSSGVYQPAFDINEVGFMNFHIKHDIKQNSLMYPHIHISSSGTSQEVVKFEWTYLQANRNDTTPTAFSTPITKTIEFTVPTTAHAHGVIEVPTIDAIASLEVDSIMICSLKRITNGGTDHPNRVFVHFADIHYERERLSTPEKAPDFYTP